MTEFKQEIFLVEEIKIVQNFTYLTPNIIFYSHRELLNFSQNNILKAYSDGQLVGWSIIKPLMFGRFQEIAVLGVLEGFENKGIGKQLFDKSCEIINNRKKSIYVVSRNASVINFLEKAEFKKVKLLPVDILIDNFLYILSLGRIKESLRKYLVYKNQSKFQFYIRYT
jgi:ribosomal protein S18 acetylase RimI-like enzyme